MEGSWRVYAPGERWGKAGHTARVVLDTGERVGVGFQLGIVELVPREHEDHVVGHLGPDLLGPDWDEHEAVRRLTADPDRPLGEALLDQRNLAGIGTIYRSETLFLSGVSPFLPVSAVGNLPKVVDLARRLLLANRPARRSRRPATLVVASSSGSTAGRVNGAVVAAPRSCERCRGSRRTTG